tara:strand:- start:13096 stop:13692 length:597 start_codon:yes stop_codon:yes gene_type:complete
MGMDGELEERIRNAVGNYMDKQCPPSSRRSKPRTRKERGCPTEYEEHRDIAEYLRACKVNFIHCLNNARSAHAARKAKRLGMVKGVADLLLFTSPPGRAGVKGVAIEVKALDGRPSVEQIDWLAEMHSDGYLAYVVWGADAGIRLLKELGYSPKKRKRNKSGGEAKRIGSKKSGVLEVQSSGESGRCSKYSASQNRLV